MLFDKAVLFHEAAASPSTSSTAIPQYGVILQ